MNPAQIVVPECPPDRIWLYQLCDLLAWYEQNLCAVQLEDPRHQFVKFGIERFPHSIHLLKRNSRKEIDQPQKQALAIKNGTKTNADFGGYDAERAQTLPWIVPAILRPTRILKLIGQQLVGEEKAGDTIYVKEFHPTGRKYRFKVMVCRTVGAKLLVPVTSHPRDHDRYGKHYQQIWP